MTTYPKTQVTFDEARFKGRLIVHVHGPDKDGVGSLGFRTEEGEALQVNGIEYRVNTTVKLPGPNPTWKKVEYAHITRVGSTFGDGVTEAARQAIYDRVAAYTAQFPEEHRELISRAEFVATWNERAQVHVEIAKTREKLTELAQRVERLNGTIAQYPVEYVTEAEDEDRGA